MLDEHVEVLLLNATMWTQSPLYVAHDLEICTKAGNKPALQCATTTWNYTCTKDTSKQTTTRACRSNPQKTKSLLAHQSHTESHL